MAVTTKKDLNLTFTTESGKEYRMTIPDYREGITDEAIKTAAAGIVADDIFAPDGFARQAVRRQASGHHDHRCGRSVKKGRKPFF